MRSSEFCIGHDPAKADERRRRASKGGKRGGRGRPQAELAALKGDIRDVITAVLKGAVETGPAAVALQGYNALLRAQKLGLDIREQTDLIERLEELEALQEGRDEGGWGRGA